MSASDVEEESGRYLGLRTWLTQRSPGHRIARSSTIARGTRNEAQSSLLFRVPRIKDSSGRGGASSFRFPVHFRNWEQIPILALSISPTVSDNGTPTLQTSKRFRCRVLHFPVCDFLHRKRLWGYVSANVQKSCRHDWVLHHCSSGLGNPVLPFQ